MSLSAEFDSAADRRAYAVVSVGAAALSYDHARTFFLPFMGTVGASVTPLMLDAVIYWLATACIRQARQGRPLPMLRLGAYALLALSITANALGGATWPERRVHGTARRPVRLPHRGTDQARPVRAPRRPRRV